VLDSLQLEFPSSLSNDRSSWKPLANAIISSLQEFWSIQLQHDLFPQSDPEQAVQTALRMPGGLGKASRLLKLSNENIFLEQKDHLRIQRYEAMVKELDNFANSAPLFDFVSENSNPNFRSRLYQNTDGNLCSVLDTVHTDDDLLQHIRCIVEPEITKRMGMPSMHVYRDRPDGVRADFQSRGAHVAFFGDLVNDLDESLGAVSMILTPCDGKTCFLDDNGISWPQGQITTQLPTYNLWYPLPGGGYRHSVVSGFTRGVIMDPHEWEMKAACLHSLQVETLKLRMEVAYKCEVESSFESFYKHVLHSIDGRLSVPRWSG